MWLTSVQDTVAAAMAPVRQGSNTPAHATAKQDKLDPLLLFCVWCDLFAVYFGGLSSSVVAAAGADFACSVRCILQAGLRLACRRTCALDGLTCTQADTNHSGHVQHRALQYCRVHGPALVCNGFRAADRAAHRGAGTWYAAKCLLGQTFVQVLCKESEGPPATSAGRVAMCPHCCG